MRSTDAIISSTVLLIILILACNMVLLPAVHNTDCNGGEEFSGACVTLKSEAEAIITSIPYLSAIPLVISILGFILGHPPRTIPRSEPWQDIENV